MNLVQAPETLCIYEIYESLQGEARYTGYPCVFVRLAGCPLRCRWCDTSYAFEGGENLTFETILEKINAYKTPLIELTGGEPLAQKNTLPFLEILSQGTQKILIETSGAHDISKIPANVHIIMDIKCPDSKMSERNLWSNIEFLKQTDDIKFVIASENDFHWAMSIIEKYNLNEESIFMSCAFGLFAPKDLSTLILRSKKNIRLQLQIHKYIWHPRAKGV